MSKVINEKTSLLDSAMGPVAVITTTHKKFDVDDYVTLSVKSKGEYLRLINKANQINPLDVEGRPVVTIGGTNLGGFDGL